MAQERKVGADFTVTVRVSVDISKAAASDAVDDTLNYAALYDVVKREMTIPSNLLEHVSARIAQAVFDTFPESQAVDVTITKLNPPMGADCQGASVKAHYNKV